MRQHQPPTPLPFRFGTTSQLCPQILCYMLDLAGWPSWVGTWYRLAANYNSCFIIVGQGYSSRKHNPPSGHVSLSLSLAGSLARSLAIYVRRLTAAMYIRCFTFLLCCVRMYCWCCDACGAGAPLEVDQLLGNSSTVVAHSSASYLLVVLISFLGWKDQLSSATISRIRTTTNFYGCSGQPRLLASAEPRCPSPGSGLRVTRRRKSPLHIPSCHPTYVPDTCPSIPTRVD